MTTTEIKCPKCGSNQLLANKKGFSGAKTLGGILNTGNIGLLAGTLDSNNIKIICLACNNEFKPGEGRIVTIPVVTKSIDLQETTIAFDINVVDQRIIELYSVGKKLAAVKFYNDQSGLGLKESKDYVDNLAAQHGITAKDGCFVATACYGDFDAPEVLALRQFRDNRLLTTSLGKIFVAVYYSTSPFLVRVIAKSARLKKIVRLFLLQPIVKKIQRHKNIDEL
jgi:hypothetical protein